MADMLQKPKMAIEPGKSIFPDSGLKILPTGAAIPPQPASRTAPDKGGDANGDSAPTRPSAA